MHATRGRGPPAGPAASARRPLDGVTRAASAVRAARIAAYPRTQCAGSRSFSIGACGGGLARTAGAFLAVLVEFLANPFPLQVRQVVDEQFALEMIHLVLQA